MLPATTLSQLVCRKIISAGLISSTNSAYQLLAALVPRLPAMPL